MTGRFAWMGLSDDRRSLDRVPNPHAFGLDCHIISGYERKTCRGKGESMPRADLAVITFNDVPAINHTYKYDVLGPMAIENRRRYCVRHGYDFVSEVTIARDRPACWAKIPAILDAFRTHEW